MRASVAAGLLGAAASAQDGAYPDPSGANLLRIQVGTGRLRHSTHGGGGDEADATWFRLGYEYAREDGFGGGVRLDVAGSEDELFDDAGAASAAGLFDLFAHATWTQADDGWRLPLRFGLDLHDYTLEEDVGGGSIDWFTFGFRAEVEPEWIVASSATMRFSLAAPLDFAVGPTWVETDPDTEGWSTSMLGADVGILLRIGVEDARFEIGYRRTWLAYDETDARAGLRVRAVDVDAQFFVLGFTLRF